MNWVIFCCFTFLLCGNGITALIHGLPEPVEDVANPQDKLIHVHSVWRHGERNPSHMFPINDLNNITDFPSGLGQLTKNGIKQLHTLGRNFQSKYVNNLQFLSADKINKEVYARSTDVDRALISAMSFFSGLFTNDSAIQPINSTTNFKLAPVPIHSMSVADDPLQFLTFECQRKNVLWDIVHKSSAIETLLNNSQVLLSQLSDYFQTEMNFNQISAIYDTVWFETLLGLPIPQWIEPNKPELYKLTYDYFAYLWGFLPFPNDLPSNLQTELKKISSGFLLNEIMDRMNLKIKCEKQLGSTKECDAIKAQKFYGYSGHDITQISLFLGLGYQNFFVPSVGSAVVLELWENKDYNTTNGLTLDEQYYVKIYFYENSNVKIPQYIGCSGNKGCPISYLSNRAALIRPTPNLKAFCQQPL